MENKKIEDCPFCDSDKIDTWDKICETGRTVFLLIVPIADVKDLLLIVKNKQLNFGTGG